MSIRKSGRYWALYDATGALVCICLYKTGAAEVLRRLQQVPAPPVPPTTTRHTARRRSPPRHCEAAGLLPWSCPTTAPRSRLPTPQHFQQTGRCFWEAPAIEALPDTAAPAMPLSTRVTTTMPALIHTPRRCLTR